MILLHASPARLYDIVGTVVDHWHEMRSSSQRRPLYEMATDEYQPHTGHKKYDDDLTQPQETGELASTSSGEESNSLVSRNSHIC